MTRFFYEAQEGIPLRPAKRDFAGHGRTRRILQSSFAGAVLSRICFANTEARSGIEPLHSCFADSRVTSSPPSHELSKCGIQYFYSDFSNRNDSTGQTPAFPLRPPATLCVAIAGRPPHHFLKLFHFITSPHTTSPAKIAGLFVLDPPHLPFRLSRFLLRLKERLLAGW